MKRVDEETPSDGGPVLAYGWAVVLSVFLVMAGLFFGLPMLVQTIPEKEVWIPLALLALPAFPTVTGWLQGRMECRLPGDRGPRSLLREYLYHTWRLALDLTMLLASLPLIAAQLVGVIAAIMLIAFGVVLLLACARQVFGLRMEGVSQFEASDIWLAGKILLGSVGATIAAFGLGAVLDCVFDRGIDIAAVMNRRVIRWLRKHV
jgi:hypothetical protein